MFEVAYTLFFFALVLEVALFLFLNVPTPRGWKAVVVKFLNTNPTVKTILRVQIGFCVIAALFLVNCQSQERRFMAEKHEVRAKDSYASGTFVVR
jgi:hypothetical protein